MARFVIDLGNIELSRDDEQELAASLQKVALGKVAAAGALIGAVMKEMRGQADAGRVRELILEKLQ